MSCPDLTQEVHSTSITNRLSACADAHRTLLLCDFDVSELRYGGAVRTYIKEYEPEPMAPGARGDLVISSQKSLPRFCTDYLIGRDPEGHLCVVDTKSHILTEAVVYR